MHGRAVAMPAAAARCCDVDARFGLQLDSLSNKQ